MPEYLTTKELAELLRVKERKVYDLAAAGAVPCSRATGKLLFPRAAVEAWIADHADGPAPRAATGRPAVVLGSHDPLLDWALRDSGAGLATYFDGSLDGLDRFAAREGLATGLHVYDPAPDAPDRWNVSVAAARCGDQSAVLVTFAVRQRGLIVAEALQDEVRGLGDLEGRRLATRQAAAGAQQTLEALLADRQVAVELATTATPARTEADAALAVADGSADIAFGLAALAAQYRLPFVPVIEERFDLLVDRRAWFEPQWQSFYAFCRTDAFRGRAATLTGYDVGAFGTVRWNGP